MWEIFAHLNYSLTDSILQHSKECSLTAQVKNKKERRYEIFPPNLPKKTNYVNTRSFNKYFMPKIYERRVGGVQNAIYGDFQVPYSAYF